MRDFVLAVVGRVADVRMKASDRPLSEVWRETPPAAKAHPTVPLRRSATRGVGVSESGGPQVISGREGLVGPAGLVAEAMVVAAEGSEVRGDGGPAFGVRDAVVDVAVSGGHAAAGKHTTGVGGFDLATLADGGAPAGGSGVDDLTGGR